MCLYSYLLHSRYRANSPRPKKGQVKRSRASRHRPTEGPGSADPQGPKSTRARGGPQRAPTGPNGPDPDGGLTGGLTGLIDPPFPWAHKPPPRAPPGSLGGFLAGCRPTSGLTGGGAAPPAAPGLRLRHGKGLQFSGPSSAREKRAACSRPPFVFARRGATGSMRRARAPWGGPRNMQPS